METVEGENPSSHIMGTVEEEPEQSESPIKVDKEENLPAKAMKSSAEKTFRPHFVERVTKWPMINATLAFTTTTYNKVKVFFERSLISVHFLNVAIKLELVV